WSSDVCSSDLPKQAESTNTPPHPPPPCHRLPSGVGSVYVCFRPQQRSNRSNRADAEAFPTKAPVSVVLSSAPDRLYAFARGKDHIRHRSRHPLLQNRPIRLAFGSLWYRDSGKWP